MSWSVQAYRPSSSPPRGTKVVPRIGILLPMVAALPTATFEPAFGASCAIVLTRSMRAARRWIRQQRRGTERAGLVASSSAQRLKPRAIDIRVNIDPVHWFLSPAKDTRSSLYLEDAATEFQVQGLELDWTIVTWDADLRWSGDDWSYHSFRGAQKKLKTAGRT